jgi:hypothetical protein
MRSVVDRNVAMRRIPVRVFWERERERDKPKSRNSAGGGSSKPYIKFKTFVCSKRFFCNLQRVRCVVVSLKSCFVVVWGLRQRRTVENRYFLVCTGKCVCVYTVTGRGWVRRCCRLMLFCVGLCSIGLAIDVSGRTDRTRVSGERWRNT